MTDYSDVVERADSLMRRRRSFVATPVNKVVTEVASAPTPVIEDDDLPVLTEVVSADAAVSEAVSKAGPDRFDETQLSLMATEIAHAIGQQLTSELPSLLESALLNAGEELRAGITATMETVLRDFIARRKQLSLPLNEPDAGH